MPVSNDLIKVIKSHKNFYRGWYHVLSSILLGALTLIVILSFLLLYLYIIQPERNFYATCYDGKLMQLEPLNAPNYSKNPLI